METIKKGRSVIIRHGEYESLSGFLLNDIKYNGSKEEFIKLWNNNEFELAIEFDHVSIKTMKKSLVDRLHDCNGLLPKSRGRWFGSKDIIILSNSKAPSKKQDMILRVFEDSKKFHNNGSTITSEETIGGIPKFKRNV